MFVEFEKEKEDKETLQEMFEKMFYNRVNFVIEYLDNRNRKTGIAIIVNENIEHNVISDSGGLLTYVEDPTHRDIMNDWGIVEILDVKEIKGIKFII